MVARTDIPPECRACRLCYPDPLKERVMTVKKPTGDAPTLSNAIETLGEIIEGPAGRDAVHVAVVPVTALTILYPGQHIVMDDDYMASPATPLNGRGIVDPFLSGPVYPNQRFWMFIYPRTITGLRHVWTHPDFPDERAGDTEVPNSTGAPVQEDPKAVSEKWLRDFIGASDAPGYDEVMAVALGKDPYAGWDQDDDEYPYSARNTGEYLFFSGTDAHGPIPPEFWHHVEVVSGQKVPESQRASHFSCSC